MQLNAAKNLCILDFIRFGLGLQAFWDWSALSAVFFWWRRFRSCIEQLLPNVMQ